MIREKDTCTKTTVTGTQAQISVEQELKIETEEHLNAFILSGENIFSNLIETSDSNSDSDDSWV